MTRKRERREPPPSEQDKDEAKRDQQGAEDVDEQLDHELEDSFPASDPPSLTQDQK